MAMCLTACCLWHSRAVLDLLVGGLDGEDTLGLRAFDSGAGDARRFNGSAREDGVEAKSNVEMNHG